MTFTNRITREEGKWTGTISSYTTTDFFPKSYENELKKTVELSHNLFFPTKEKAEIAARKEQERSKVTREHKKNISEIFVKQLESQLSEKRDYINSISPIYKEQSFRVLNVISQFNPLSINLKITVNNTLYISAKFDNKIKIEINLFIRDLDKREVVPSAYTIFQGSERVTSRYTKKPVENELRNGLEKYFNKNTETDPQEPVIGSTDTPTAVVV